MPWVLLLAIRLSGAPEYAILPRVSNLCFMF